MDTQISQKAERDFDFEWPTLALALLCIVGVTASTYFADAMTLWLAIPFLSVVLALHSSLQHEVLHGHPFDNRYLNEALVFVGAGLFVPFRRFKDLHIQHHNDENLTDPYDDPETNFHAPEVWARTNRLMRVVWTFNNTLVGRMMIGPMLGLLSFYRADLKLVLRCNFSVIFAYVLHMLGLLPVIYWLLTYSTMPIWAYLVSAYAAVSLLKIRTFLEHRADELVKNRTAIINDRGFFAFLFLNNNFHALHHEKPKLAWYRLRAQFDADRDAILTSNGNYIYKSYGEIFRKYFFRTKDQVPHPIGVNRDLEK